MGDNELDIIDAAMTGDDTDYGDKTPSTQDDSQQDTGGERHAPDSGGSSLPAQRDTDGGQSSRAPGRVPSAPGRDQGGSQGMRRVGPQYADGRGNIVDKDGRIIARAGGEARLWQEASRATAQVNNLTRQLQVFQNENTRMKGLIDKANEIANLPQKFGISREDFNEGITLMSKWRADPLGVCKEIIARTMTYGYNATDILGKTAGDAIEVKAIQQMIREATAPLVDQKKQQTQTTEQDTRAKEAYDSFVAKYENADVHAEAIANLMNKGATAVDAYYSVREFALREGLDFTQPLGPQVEARMNGGGQRQNTTQQRAPMVQGNGRGSNPQITDQPNYAAAEDSWTDILNSVLRE
jgi:hypothetical protein